MLLSAKVANLTLHLGHATGLSMDASGSEVSEKMASKPDAAHWPGSKRPNRAAASLKN
jgi:hypothetical protein